ncbi:MAG: signal peptidase II [Verrucomicrobiota bacterium]
MYPPESVPSTPPEAGEDVPPPWSDFLLRHLRWFWGPLALILVLDQATKWWAQTELQPLGRIVVIPDLLNWTYVRNTGVAFGMAQGQNYLLAGIAVVLVGVGLWWARGLDWNRREVNLVAALIIAGAVGNLIDRLSYGYVVDFVDVLIPVIQYPWPVFNVADSVICIAVGWIILRQFVGPDVTRQ